MQGYNWGKGYHLCEQTENYGFLSLAPAQPPHHQDEFEYPVSWEHDSNVQAAALDADKDSLSSSDVYEGDAITASQSSSNSNNSKHNSVPREQNYLSSKDGALSIKFAVVHPLECKNSPGLEETELRLGLCTRGHSPSCDPKGASLQLPKNGSASEKSSSATRHVPSTLHHSHYISDAQCSSHEVDTGRSSMALIGKNGVKRAYNDAMMQTNFPSCGVMSLIGKSAHDTEVKQSLIQQVQGPSYIKTWQHSTCVLNQHLSTHGNKGVEMSSEMPSDVHLKVVPSGCRDNGKQPVQQDFPNDKLRVVGWPPVRSFRKNSLAAHTKQLDAVAESDETEDTGSGPVKPCLFVKVNMQGVPIGRKVDLNAYKGYDELTFVLNDMFQSFSTESSSVRRSSSIPSDASQVRMFNASDYVLTYEDKEGDWMLVGDVPWEMFVSSVRRLLITKVA